MTVVATKRKNIVHLRKMSDKRFKQMLRLDDFAPLKFRVFLKVDGVGIRFGKTEHGVFYMETSNSGPVFDANEFVYHAVVYNKNLDRALHYRDMFSLLKDLAESFGDWLKGKKVIAEALYVPMGIPLSDNTINFVNIAYPVEKLASVLTVYMIKLLDSDGKEIGGGFPDYCKNGVELRHSFIGDNYFDKTWLAGFDLNRVREILTESAAYWSDNQAVRMLGRVNEGLVIECNGETFKIIEPEFEAIIREKKQRTAD